MYLCKALRYIRDLDTEHNNGNCIVKIHSNLINSESNNDE